MLIAAAGDPVARLVLSVALVLGVAKLMGHLATRVGQPAVLGELIGGVVLGNLGWSFLAPMREDPMLDMLGRVGALILLFEVGLESKLGQLLRVGLSALLVATVGVIGPFLLGLGVVRWLLPEAGPYAHAFIAATLCATSVGITARVLKDLGRLDGVEARIILGAAVIDDVLGLLVLGVVTAIAVAADRGAPPSWLEIGFGGLKAIAFVVGAILLGLACARPMFRLASRLRGHGVLLTAGLFFCFVLSWLADRVGLAPIVGAFAAGLVLEEAAFVEFTSRGEPALDKLVAPVSHFLVPIFFVLMGMRTDLGAFGRREAVGLAAALTVAAVLGKQICGLAVVERGVDRIFVGLGMIPRGEVGLVVASMGLHLTVAGRPALDAAAYSAAVIMVVATTLMTPPLLEWRARRMPSAPVSAR